jgi:hypothetical protein
MGQIVLKLPPPNFSRTTSSFTGAAGDQVDRVIAAVEALVRAYPDAAAYAPGAIL